MAEAGFEEGRYLYCAVGLSDAAEAGEGFSATGVDGEPVALVRTGDLGAVVHACDALYDSADEAVVRRWLLDHQRVVDAAGEAFGTPLPVRFDTVLRGDDARVRAWLDEHAATLSTVLDSLAGCWEYRIEVLGDEDALEAALADDDRLAELRDRLEGAGSGTAHLLEKQYERRLAELKHDRRAERARDLEDRLAPLAEDLRDLGTERATTIETPNRDAEGAVEARLAVLARAELEADLGDALDGVAAEPGVEVRFTGPWPPYTFAPSIGDEQATGEAGDGRARDERAGEERTDGETGRNRDRGADGEGSDP
jgi:hypothetical protein